jgi:hypothetical protein
MENTHQTNTNKSAPEIVHEEVRQMEAVRKLLFGQQMAQVKASLSAMEERLGSVMDAGRRSLEGKMEALDGFVRSEVDGGRELVKTEEVSSLERERGLREQLSGMNRSLWDSIQEQASKFGAYVEAASSLVSAKTDREELGDLLAELSDRLRGNSGASTAGVRVLQR